MNVLHDGELGALSQVSVGLTVGQLFSVSRLKVRTEVYGCGCVLLVVRQCLSDGHEKGGGPCDRD